MTYSHTGARGRAGARVQVLPLLTGSSHAETHWAMAQPRWRGALSGSTVNGVYEVRDTKRGLATERVTKLGHD